MRNKLRIFAVGLVAVLTVGALASGALLAQSEQRITPLDSPIALFCGGAGNTSLSAYRFDKDGKTHFAWTTDIAHPAVPVVPTPEETAAPGATAIITTPVPPTNVIIDQEGVGLHLEDDGRLSVSTTQWDGKIFVLFFHGCPDPGSLDAFVIDNNV